MRARQCVAISLSACLLLTGCEALTARKYLATPTERASAGDEASISSVAFRTLNDARAAYVSSDRFTVSDDRTHVEFVRDLDDADLTTTIGEATYGVKFDTEVSMLAFDISNDSTQELRTALKLAGERSLGVSLSKNQTYALTEPITIPAGVAYIDGHGADIDINMSGTEDKASNAFIFAPKTSGVKLTNMVLDMSDSAYTRGVFGDAITDTTISNIVMNGVNYRGVELVADSGELKNIQVENNKINNILGDKNTKDKILSIIIDASKGKYTSSNLSVVGNTINGGYHGISLTGVSNSVVRGNTITGNTRNISLQNHCSNNVVEDNKLSDSFSAAVHISNSSDNNQVKNNTINSSVSYGQGLLEAYNNSNGNNFTGNSVTVKGDIQPNWILYVGTDSSNTKFQDNTIDGGGSRALVGVEPAPSADAPAATAGGTGGTGGTSPAAPGDSGVSGVSGGSGVAGSGAAAETGSNAEATPAPAETGTTQENPAVIVENNTTQEQSAGVAP